MFNLNKTNFSVLTLEKEKTSVSAPKNTYYADFKVCLALKGSATWEIEDKSYEIEEGDIIFLNIGQKRQFTSFGENGFKLCIFSLTRSAFQDNHHFWFFIENTKRDNVIKSSSYIPLLKEIYTTWSEPFFLKYELASAKLTEFFLKAENDKKFDYNHSYQSDLQISKVIDYIDENIKNGITLKQASKKALMSESTFSRRFLKANGISFKQYIVAKKIDRAIHLLETTNMKMIDIAFESGFDSISGFYDAFKKITGVTPNKF